jgi:hypothetical protein
MHATHFTFHSARLESLEPRLLLDGLSEAQAIELFDTSPALFVENMGQWEDESVRFVHHGAGCRVAMTDAGAVFQVVRGGPASDGDEPPGGPFDAFDNRPANLEALRFSASFAGSNAVAPVGLSPHDARFNYLLGHPSGWIEGAPTYASVAYEELYDGIDLHMWGRRSHLKYEFHVAPGADPSQIAVRYEGVESLSIDDAGQLVVDLGDGWGRAVDEAPYIYQDIDGRRVEVAGRFVLLDETSYSFEIEDRYDPTRELIVDPELDWSTYLGGSSYDDGFDIAVAPNDDILVTGETLNSGWGYDGFAATQNSGYDRFYDAFVVRLDSSGDLLWSTFLGGSRDDRGHGVAADSSGNVLVTGTTDSFGWVWGGYDTNWDGEDDAFVAKLSASEGLTLWSSYLGGTLDDFGCDIAVDSLDNVVATGRTDSSGWVSGGFDTTHNGGYDPFAVKLSSSGSHLWSTYLGGNGAEFGWAVAVNSLDEIVLAGGTRSSGWVSGGFDTSYNGGGDPFVAKLSASGGHLWSTFLGGSGVDEAYDLALDPLGHALVTGTTGSSGWVSDGFDTSFNGYYDTFVVRLDSSGDRLWSTYLGGTGQDWGQGVATDSHGDVLVTGYSESGGWVSGGFDTTFNGGSYDAFVAKLSASGDHRWSTYLGGSGWDWGKGIAVDSLDDLLVTGHTRSDDWVSGGYDTSPNGNADAFVARITDFLTGDFDGNGAVNGLDIPGFKSALADPDAWSAAHPDRPHPDLLGDFDGNGAFNGLDIPGFKSALATGVIAGAAPLPASHPSASQDRQPAHIAAPLLSRGVTRATPFDVSQRWRQEVAWWMLAGRRRGVRARDRKTADEGSFDVIAFRSCRKPVTPKDSSVGGPPSE